MLNHSGWLEAPAPASLSEPSGLLSGHRCPGSSLPAPLTSQKIAQPRSWGVPNSPIHPSRSRVLHVGHQIQQRFDFPTACFFVFNIAQPALAVGGELRVVPVVSQLLDALSGGPVFGVPLPVVQAAAPLELRETSLSTVD